MLRDAPVVTTDSGPSIHAAAGALVGAQTPRVFDFQARAELFAGGRIVGLSLRERYDCNHDGCAGLLGAQWMLEPRVAVDYWAFPQVTFGAWVGSDVLHNGNVSGGLSFVLHTRTFDAR